MQKSNFMEQYQILRQAKENIQNNINQLIDEDAKGNFQQIHTLIKKRDQFKDSIIKLLKEDTENLFEQYAKNLFDMSLDIIQTYLLDLAIRFDTLSADKRLDFAQTFLNHIAERLQIVPNKLAFKEEEPGYNLENWPKYKGAASAFKKINIYLNQDYDGPNSLTDFMGMILHEFTHYLYFCYPELCPLGKEKTVAVTENLVLDEEAKNLDEYKQLPHEAPAYYVQEYFKKHNFEKQLVSRLALSKQKINNGLPI